jgi:hypothetical protein
MKKTLLATTALVAGGAIATPATAADPIKLELRGYYQFMIVVGHTDRDLTGATLAGGQSYRPENFKYEGEIWFTGTTKLDNGTSIGVRIELEGWSQNTGVSAANATGSLDQIDEEYIFAFGDWGRIEFGGTDSASFKMQYSSPSALIGWGFNDHNFNFFGNGFAASNGGGRGGNILGTGAAQNAGYSGDATKFTYFTPRFAGFQFGLSYTPSFSATGSTTNCQFRGGGGNFNNCPRNLNAFHNGLDIAANYLNKFGDVSVALYGAYATAGFDRGPTGAGNASAGGKNSSGRYKTWAVGAQIGVAGFTLGGGLGMDNNGSINSANRTNWYTVSVMYETGPWQVSAGWWGGRNRDAFAPRPTGLANACNGLAGGGSRGNCAGTDKLDYFEVGANYALSPGIKLTGGAFYYVGSGQSVNEKADSWAVVFGTALTF